MRVLPEQCGSCVYYRPEGDTGGTCNYDPQSITKSRDGLCRHWAPDQSRQTEADLVVDDPRLDNVDRNEVG